MQFSCCLEIKQKVNKINHVYLRLYKIIGLRLDYHLKNDKFRLHCISDDYLELIEPRA